MLVVYLVTVVLLVRRQICQVQDEEEEEEEVMVIDNKGKTEKRLFEDVLSNSTEVLM